MVSPDFPDFHLGGLQPAGRQVHYSPSVTAARPRTLAPRRLNTATVLPLVHTNVSGACPYVVPPSPTDNVSAIATNGHLIRDCLRRIGHWKLLAQLSGLNVPHRQRTIVVQSRYTTSGARCIYRGKRCQEPFSSSEIKQYISGDTIWFFWARSSPLGGRHGRDRRHACHTYELGNMTALRLGGGGSPPARSPKGRPLRSPLGA